MRCPFHDDRQASASINLAAGAYKCHACDIHGDIFSLVKRVEGIASFKDQVEFIKRRFT